MAVMEQVEFVGKLNWVHVRYHNKSEEEPNTGMTYGMSASLGVSCIGRH